MRVIKLNLVCKEFISVNHYMAYRPIKKGNKYIVVAYKPKETKEFEKSFGDYIRGEIKKQDWIKPPKDKLIIMDTIFYLPRVDMDVQNYFKTLSDVMTTNGVWEDDNVVMERVNRIYYDSNNPRILITIYPSDFEGIFDNKKEKNEYIDNCKKCKRYKNNCSILNKVLENRIQNDVIKDNANKWRCNKFKQ